MSSNSYRPFKMSSRRIRLVEMRSAIIIKAHNQSRETKWTTTIALSVFLHNTIYTALHVSNNTRNTLKGTRVTAIPNAMQTIKRNAADSIN